MAIDGASPADLWSFLESRSFGHFWNQLKYLDTAFLQDRGFTLTGPPGNLTDDRWHRLIAEKRDAWRAHRLPELMRLRDYFSFMQFARDEHVVVVVCGANPAAGRWIGQPGVRCYAGRLPIPTSATPPHDGLLAADPGDARLVAMLGLFDPPLSFTEYVRLLAAQGLDVSSERDGFVVKDELGNRFHDSYRLHSVYDASGETPVWVHPRAERLRAALNRHLGADLVLFGPHEDWEFRNDKKIAGPLWGPQAPAIEFTPNQEISNRLTARDLAEHLQYSHHPRWSAVFPEHQIEKQS